MHLRYEVSLPSLFDTVVLQLAKERPDFKGWGRLTHIVRSAGASGGTTDTVITTLESAKLSELAKSTDEFCLAASPVPPTRTTLRKSLFEAVCGVREVSDLGTLTTSPSGMVDTTTVIRSSTLMSDLYGPNFSYREYLRVRNVLMGTAFHLAMNIAVALLLIAPFRWMARNFVPAPGSGPTKEETADDFSEHRVIVSSDQKDSKTGKPKRVFGSIARRGDMYGLTGLTVSAAAKVILEHEEEIKKISAGFVTPATLGHPYIEELEKGGFKIEAKVLD